MPSPAEQVADLLPHRAVADPAGTFVLGIDGRSGAGKSSLATAVVDLLRARGPRGADRAASDRVALLRLDDHYPGWTGLRAGVEAVTPLVAAVRRGRPGSAPTWDWHRGAPGPERHVPDRHVAGHHPPGWAAVHPAALVVEGCGATLLHAELDALVWLEVPEDVRRARAADRDGEVASWWAAWAAQEAEAMRAAPPEQYADLRLT